ncbi:MAG: right-handed parallel beta-helix repeat-containing protein [Candidatus Lokiarchaeota archaeon]|nr:right-handed parallel beta-helix repeat-containing protein [Candidatus Lokiarchaeota archaeon]
MQNRKLFPYFFLSFIFTLSILSLITGSSEPGELPSSSDDSPYVIFINGNAQLGNYVAGNGTSGTLDNPHIIENCSILTTNKQYGIFIQNVDLHLILRNCSITTIDSSISDKNAIEIRLSSNIRVENCTVTHHNIGIMLLNTHKSTIISSTVTQNDFAGIELLESDGNHLENNNIYQNMGYGIYLKRSHENTIINNKIEKNHDLCILDRGNDNFFENNSCDPSTSKINNKIWLWVILGVGFTAFFVISLIIYTTWKGHE